MDRLQEMFGMNKIREFMDLALCIACIALPFVLYFAFVMKPWPFPLTLDFSGKNDDY